MRNPFRVGDLVWYENEQYRVDEVWPSVCLITRELGGGMAKVVRAPWRELQADDVKFWDVEDTDD